MWGLKRALKVWLVGWLKHRPALPIPDEVQMPELLCYTVEEGTQKLRETEIPEWTYHIRLAHLPGRVPTTVRKKSARRGSDSLKTSVVALLCMSEITLGVLLLSGDPSMQWE